MKKCVIPVSAHFTVSGGKITSEEYKMSEVAASKIADLLLEEFGLDYEEQIHENSAA